MFSLVSYLAFKSTKRIHPERITKAVQNMVNDLDYEGIRFLSLKGVIVRLNQKKIVFSLMYFVMKMI